MTIEQFQLLDHTNKEYILWTEGYFLMNYEQGNSKCDVYALFNFYVSVCYELKVNKRADMVAAVHPDELPYIARLQFQQGA